MNAAASRGLPDGGNYATVNIDYYSYVDFTIGTAGGVIIHTLPSLPYPAIIKPLANTASPQITIHGLAINQPGPPAYADTWIPAFIYPEFSLWTGEPTAATASLCPFNFSKSRIKGQSWELIYTGTANTCSGVVNVMESPTNMDLTEANLNTLVLELLNYTDKTAAGSFLPSARYIKGDVNTTINNYTLKNENCRPERGCVGIIRHNSDDYKFVQNFTSPAVIANNDLNLTRYSLLGNGVVTGSNLTQIGGVYCYDDDWSSHQIVLSGAQNGATYRFSVKTCVEHIPQPNSIIARYATQPPSSNPRTLEAVEDFLKHAPMTTPASNPSGLMKSFLKAVEVGAPVIGSVFGPEGTAVGAALSSVTSLLASTSI